MVYTEGTDLENLPKDIMTMHEKAEAAAETMEQLKQMQQTEQPKPEAKKGRGEGKRTETVKTISRKCREWNDHEANLTEATSF